MRHHCRGGFCAIQNRELDGQGADIDADVFHRCPQKRSWPIQHYDYAIEAPRVSLFFAEIVRWRWQVRPISEFRTGEIPWLGLSSQRKEVTAGSCFWRADVAESSSDFSAVYKSAL
jgi:hypothetical protein